MTGPKHTPGPWTASGNGGVYGADGNPIPFYSGFISEAWYGEQPAIDNARLIAASLDLFEALSSVMHLLDGEAWEVARAAIAKAEGLP